MKRKLLASLLLNLTLVFPLIAVSILVVALLLLTKWDGRSTVFGNSKWGRANDHFAFPTKGFWQEFNWLVLRNPVNNFHTQTLAVTASPYVINGDETIGDKIAGGFYEVLRLKRFRFWEYYWIKPYSVFGARRCIRVRIGWKLHDCADSKAAFVFAINPFKKYTGK